MKYLRITLAVFAMLTLLLASACTGGGSSSGSSSGSQTSGQSSEAEEPDEAEEPVEAEEPDEAEEPVEPEIFDFAGTDPDELLDAWENVGENPDELDFLLKDEYGEELSLIEWHITEITRDDIDEYTMEIEEGEYWVQALGGSGIVNLWSEAYDEEGISIGHFDHDGNFPMFWLKIEEAMEIAVTFDWGRPWEDEQGVPWTDKESVFYCWFIYEI